LHVLDLLMFEVNRQHTAAAGLKEREEAVTPFAVEARGFSEIIPAMDPRFSEMNKVLVNNGKSQPYEGYVIATLFKDGRWIYKLSISKDPRSTETYDNWVPEKWLTLTK